MAGKWTGTGCDASSRSLMRIKNSGSVVIDVGSRATKVVVPDAETTTVPTIVHGIRREYEHDCCFAVGRSWCSARGWFILRPFKDLDAFKNHFDAAVCFLVEIIRSHVLKSAGLLNGLKRRREIAVALPAWLMADVELACKFYGEVSKSLKRYSITFVDSRVALAAYMNKRFGEERDFCQISPRAASMGQRKDCLVKYVFLAVLMLVLCGCAQCDRFVLSTGESVETLYYHECRMPDEVMTEMWIDFPSRRLRVKCGLHDALGWSSSLYDGVRIDVRLEEGEWRRLVRKLRRAKLEAWPNSMSAEGDAGASSWYLRMTSIGRNIEKFRPREMPAGAEYMREIVRGALERGGHFSVACDNGRAH